MSEYLTTTPESYARIIQLNGPGVYYPEFNGIYAGTMHPKNSNIKYLLFLPNIKIPTYSKWYRNNETYHKNIPTSKWDGYSNTKNSNSDSFSDVIERYINATNIDDWYIPAIDELEVCYRNFKPSRDENIKDGINFNSFPFGRRYISKNPDQTLVEDFKQFHRLHFTVDYHWSSTTEQFNLGHALSFSVGKQATFPRSKQLEVRVVRRVLIENR